MVFDEPILVEAWIDLDGGETHVTMNGVYELGWAWSGPFEGIDFYGLSCGGATAYTVDSLGIQLVDECGISETWNDGQLEVGATTDGAGLYEVVVTDDTASHSHVFDACPANGTVSILPANMAAATSLVNTWAVGAFGGGFFVDCTMRNYADSVAFCAELAPGSGGATIASIHNDQENADVLAMIQAQGCYAYLGAESDGEGTWSWNDGSPWDYVSPQNDGLTGTGETKIAFQTNGEWHDWGTGSSTHGVVCKLPANDECSPTEVILSPGSYLAVTPAATAYSAGGVIDVCGVPGGDNTTCSGCTDPLAENYVEGLVVNDGSCWYIYPCDGDSVDLHLFDDFGDGWNGNMLALTDCNGDPLAQALTSLGLPDSYTLEHSSGGNHDGDSVIHDVCLPSGILDAGFILDVGGGNWQNEISWQLLGLDENGASTVILPVDGGLGYGGGTWNEGCPVGCTDPTALNYDGLADLEILDDGSCEYPTGCTDPAADNYVADAIVDDGSCDGVAYMSMNLASGAGDVSWNIQYASGVRLSDSTCPDDSLINSEAECIAAAESLGVNYASSAGPEWASGCLVHGGSAYYSAHEDGSSQDPTDAYICIATDPVCQSDSYSGMNHQEFSVFGCQLEENVAYALSCDAADGGGWGSSWQTFGLTIEGTTLCSGFASCGWGQSGCSAANEMAYFQYGADGICIECVTGCTDSFGLNYDATALIDGPCEYPHVCEDELDLHLFDSYGDGWNGNTISLTDCNGVPLTVEDSYTISSGDFHDHDVCIASDALDSGYILTVGGGNWAAEISWELIGLDDDNSTVVLLSGAGESFDDSTCCFIDLHLADSYGDGWNGNTISLTDCNGVPLTTDDSYTISSGNAGLHDICIASDVFADALEDGYILTVGGGNWASEISWELLDFSSGVEGGVVLLSGAGESEDSTCE
jgi:hypothetical protein